MPSRALDRRSDVDLMRLLQGGDPDAFDLLYRRHGDAAFSLAYRIAGDFTMAEEIVQDAFVALWRESHTYRDGRGSVRSWMFGIVHHRAIDALRRHARSESRRTSAEGLADRRSSLAFPELEALRRDGARATWAELGSLPAAQQEVIRLAFQGGLTYNEIAELLGLPLGTVKGRMRLGLKKLRRSFDAPDSREELAA